MSKNLRAKWLAGWSAGMALVGACGTPEEGVKPEQVGVESQEVSSGDLQVRLTGGSTFGAEQKVTVTVTYTNASGRALRLLRWFTPAQGLEEELFLVLRNGEPVEAKLPHYKRPAAQERDFIVLPPGQSLSFTAELDEAYDFSQTGTYTLRFEADALRTQGFTSGPGQRVQSNEVQLWVEGRASALKDTGDVVAAAGPITYSGRCDATQQSTLVQAVSAASAMANNSVSYLQTTAPSGTLRYTTWFGAFSTSGWNTATSHFVAIKGAFDSQPLTLDCSCKKQYYAYVYPTQPYKIYVCSAFWAAPMTGTDSKGGTLIHEMSHFNVVAGTDDWAYGQTNAKSLAKSDPSKALDNADNHEYFAENTPFQN